MGSPAIHSGRDSEAGPMVNGHDMSEHAQGTELPYVTPAHPSRLWIRCSDSPPDLVDLIHRQAVLAHANPGNLAAPSDISFSASLKMAIDIYEVDEIAVCGHYSCASVEAAASGIRRGILGEWLSPIRSLARRRSGPQAGAGGPPSSVDALAEMNVVQQTLNVTRNSVVRNAWADGKRVTVFGMIFDPASGSLDRVCDPISSATELDAR